jgi:hypothetical protein
VVLRHNTCCFAHCQVWSWSLRSWYARTFNYFSQLAAPISSKLSAESRARSEFNSTHISRYCAYYRILSPEPVVVSVKFVLSSQCLLDSNPGPGMGRLYVDYSYGLPVQICLRVCQNVNSRSALHVFLAQEVPITSPKPDSDSRNLSLILPLWDCCI